MTTDTTHITKEALLQARNEASSFFDGCDACEAWIVRRATKISRAAKLSAQVPNWQPDKAPSLHFDAQESKPVATDALRKVLELVQVGSVMELPWIVSIRHICEDALSPSVSAQDASPNDGWIKCSKRLPEFGEIVFLLSGNSIFAGARSDSDEDGWVWANQTMAWRLNDPDGLEDDDSEPTHWRPMFSLPEPPHD